MTGTSGNLDLDTDTLFSLQTLTKDDITTRTGDGWWQTATATQAEGWPLNTTWSIMLSALHENAGNYYGMQIAAPFAAGLGQRFFMRNVENIGTTPWSEIFTTSNGGPGSTYNADLLDNEHGAFYQNSTNQNAGTLSDARLSSNVPLKNANNVFTGVNTIQSAAPGLRFFETGVTVDNGGWDFIADAENLYFRTLNDAITNAIPYMTVSRTNVAIDAVTFHEPVHISDPVAARLFLIDNAAAADTKDFYLHHDNGILYGGWASDAHGPVTNWLQVGHTGTATTSITMTCANGYFNASAGYVITSPNISLNATNAVYFNAPVTQHVGSTPTQWIMNTLGSVPANQGKWLWQVSASSLNLYAANDANSAVSTPLTVYRQGTDVLHIHHTSAYVNTYGAHTVRATYPILYLMASGGTDSNFVGIQASNNNFNMYMVSDNLGVHTPFFAVTRTGTTPAAMTQTCQSFALNASGSVAHNTPFMQQRGLNPQHLMYDDPGTNNARIWRFLTSGGGFYLQAMDDANSAGSSAIYVARTGAAATVMNLATNTQINLNTPSAVVNGSFTVNGVTTMNFAQGAITQFWKNTTTPANYMACYHSSGTSFDFVGYVNGVGQFGAMLSFDYNNLRWWVRNQLMVTEKLFAQNAIHYDNVADPPTPISGNYMWSGADGRMRIKNYLGVITILN